jgi:hypothetical protein
MKICKNKECRKEIKVYKSSKRKYCNDRCKSRAAYLQRQIECAYQIDMDKALQKNYKILNKLKEMDLGFITMQTMKSHGFNFNALHKDKEKIDDDGKMVTVSCIYDLEFNVIENKIRIYK